MQSLLEYLLPLNGFCLSLLQNVTIAILRVFFLRILKSQSPTLYTHGVKGVKVIRG